MPRLAPEYLRSDPTTTLKAKVNRRFPPSTRECFFYLILLGVACLMLVCFDAVIRFQTQGRRNFHPYRHLATTTSTLSVLSNSLIETSKHNHKVILRRYKHDSRFTSTTDKQTNTSMQTPCSGCKPRFDRSLYAANYMTFPHVLRSNIRHQQDMMTIDGYRSKYGTPNLLFLLSDQHRFDVFGRASGAQKNSKFSSAIPTSLVPNKTQAWTRYIARRNLLLNPCAGHELLVFSTYSAHIPMNCTETPRKTYARM